MTPRVFCIDVTFWAASDMFGHGLAHAAQQLGVEYKCAKWNDPKLLTKIAAFDADLLLIIHGRQLIEKYKNHFNVWRRTPAALWLVDEPYEVDDTEIYAKHFEHVFIQDRSTLDRHDGAHYLPVCYDPSRHFETYENRIYRTGFIGHSSKGRRRALRALVKKELLDYVIGTYWTTPAGLAEKLICEHVEPEEAARYYQRTKIIVNVWRESHPWNEKKVAAYSLNPRVYEALACGALVVTENRPEVAEIFPDLPTFNSPKELARIARELLDDEEHMAGLLFNCRGKLAGHTYKDRLAKILKTCLNWEPEENTCTESPLLSSHF